MLSSNKPHCHPRRLKPNSKIVLINWNILEKHFSKQHHVLTKIIRLLHRPKFQIFSIESNIMVKVVRYLPKQKQPTTGAYSRLQKTAYSWVSFLPKLQAYILNKDSVRDFFQWVCLILQNIFLQNLFGWWMVLLNTIYFLC